MRKIIDGKVYDTTTAQHICTLDSQYSDPSNFKYEDTDLYRTTRGTYFLAGEGGPMSRWARPSGNMTSGGSGIVVIDAEEAREHAERAGLDLEDMEAAGFTVEAG